MGNIPTDLGSVARSSEQGEEPAVEEELVASLLDFCEYAGLGELYEVAGGGLTLRDAGVD